MKKRRKSAKALVFNPLFRCRQEAAKKGKGSYNRRPRNPQQDSGPSLWCGLSYLRPWHSGQIHQASGTICRDAGTKRLATVA